MMSIIFKGVRIDRDWHGNLRGSLSVEGDAGSMSLNLTETLCSQIMNVCADNIVEAAQETANEFRREALQLDHKMIDA